MPDVTDIESLDPASLEREAAEKARKDALAAELRLKLAADTIARYIQSLPRTSSWEEENDWISTHPAMQRWDLAADKTQTIKVTMDDLRAAPNGPCPSQRAATRLMHWVNYPHKFREYEIKKPRKEDEQAQTEAAYEKDIEWIEQQLEEVRRARQGTQEGDAAPRVPKVRKAA